jgi:hypothetical protein
MMETQGMKMTLVPIIYTSLIIFVSFSTFIILASYVAFKARSGNQARPSIEEPSFAYIPQPVKVNHAPIRREPLKVQTRTISPSYISQQNNLNYNKTESRPNKVFIQEIRRTQKEENFRPRKSAEQNRRSRQTDRIEIMNNSEKYKRTSEFDNFLPQASGTISDSNLLNYYSDQADIDFTVMNANYLRKAL